MVPIGVPVRDALQLPANAEIPTRPVRRVTQSTREGDLQVIRDGKDTAQLTFDL
jgi:hypothetical protein